MATDKSVIILVDGPRVLYSMEPEIASALADILMDTNRIARFDQGWENDAMELTAAAVQARLWISRYG